MNDISLSWKKIGRGLARIRKAANDSAPTLDELLCLVGYPDRRIKPIVYNTVPSGIKFGTWDYLQWNLSPVMDEKDKIIAAKL